MTRTVKKVCPDINSGIGAI